MGNNFPVNISHNLAVNWYFLHYLNSYVLDHLHFNYPVHQHLHMFQDLNLSYNLYWYLL